MVGAIGGMLSAYSIIDSPLPYSCSLAKFARDIEVAGILYHTLAP